MQHTEITPSASHIAADPHPTLPAPLPDAPPLAPAAASAPAAAPAHPAAVVAALLAKPPLLLPGEDPAEYAALRETIAAAVRPADVFEAFFVRDVADLTFEILRLRRLKARLMARAAARRLHEVTAKVPLRRALPNDPIPPETEDFCALAALAAAAAIDLEGVAADIVNERSFQLECFDLMLTGAELRRNAALREVARHRVVFAAALRTAATAAERPRIW